MKETIFELGPIQKQWIEDLRKYPERQAPYGLASRIAGEIKACCLGQLILTDCELTGKEAEWEGSTLHCFGKPGATAFVHNYTDYGLNSLNGAIKGGYYLEYEREKYHALAYANDRGVPWSVIADFIEQNPEAVFTKSV